jgi:hypothetical protein
MLNIIVMPISSAGERLLTAIAGKIPTANLIIIPFINNNIDTHFNQLEQRIKQKVNKFNNEIDFILLESDELHSAIIDKLLNFFHQEFKNAEVMCI